MGVDRVKPRFVFERGIAKPEVVIRRSFLAQDLAHGQTGASEQLRQQQPRRGAFQILDDMRLAPELRIIASVLREVSQAGL